MEIFEKVKNASRIEISETEELQNMSFYDLGRLANFRLKNFGDDKKVSYIFNRMINYSNVCTAKCDFCAYHSSAGKLAAFALSDSKILELVEEAVNKGATQIMLQGGLHPDFNLEWAAKIAKNIKSKFANINLHIFSPSEVICFARESKMNLFDALKMLKDSGVDSIPGAADLLVTSIREKYSPNKCTRNQWREVMLNLAKLEMKSSATMTFGMGETFEDRLDHLQFVRDIQDECNVFNAFIAWPLAPENTKLEHLPRVGAVEFLRNLAISRIFLDNIKFVQSGWLTEGLRIAQLALHFGANDMGGVLMDELVIKSAGIENKASAEAMENVIRAAGKIPFERNANYEAI